MKHLKIFVILVMVMILGFSTYAQQAFLKLGDIKGESTQSARKEWIQLDGFSFSIKESARTAATARSRAELDNITISKSIDLASPMLMQYCAEGKSIPEATMDVTQTDGSVLYKITLKDVRIVQVKSSSDCEEACEHEEEVVLSFSRMTFTYTNQKGGKTEFVSEAKKI